MRTHRLLAVAAFAAVLSSGITYAAETYQYDPAGRLTDVTYSNGGLIHTTYDANGNILSVVTSLATGVEADAPRPQLTLGPATPNPGSGPRRLAFSIPSDGHVALRVFDISGRLVATLLDRDLVAGRYDARFDTERWAAGVYFYRLTMGARTRTGRLVVVR